MQWIRRKYSLWSIARFFVVGLCAILLAAFIGAWSGIYNVAASRGHFALVELALSFIMSNSVETHALTAPTPPDLNDPDLEILGAGYFHRGCAPCHGAPGQRLNAALQSALPPPPDLTPASSRWKDRELFWIVLHGIKYTGMPALAAQDRGDEVWSLVAFLKALPRLDEGAYLKLAVGEKTEPRPQDTTIVTGCAFCHGDADRAPRSRWVPVLHGQSAAFLQSAMTSYAAGSRHSGIMQPIASDLSGRAIEALAKYYSELPPPRGVASGPDRVVEAGRHLAVDGKPDSGIPPCNSCHANEALDTFPRLAGQSAAYMARRLRHLRDGINADYDNAAVMAPIAKMMSDQEIDDASAFYSSQAPARRP